VLVGRFDADLVPKAPISWSDLRACRP
jgi:hypothetical protein